MKKLIAVALSAIVFIAVYFGSGFNISDLTDLSTEIATIESTVITQTETVTTAEDVTAPTQLAQTTTKQGIQQNGSYTTKADVSLYIHTYGKLPNNFITKSQAQSFGWPGGNLEPYASGKCIGGDYFGNYEGLLPKSGGRKYYECDIDTLGATSRGAKRLVYSNDGLIYYTANHYDSFTKLY